MKSWFSWTGCGLGLLLHIALQTIGCAGDPQRFCPSKRRLTSSVPCHSCILSVLQNCPFDFQVLPGSRTKDCTLLGNPLLKGCSFYCYRDLVEQRCCPGHWGPDCMACPERAEQPCSGHGACSDGMGGNGTCSCQDGFSGTACVDCSPNRFGPSCRSECTCVHGQCNSGLRQDGACTCFSGYKGPNCDQELPDCASLGCGPNGRCLEETGGRLSCGCAPGYLRSGGDCRAIDPCVRRPCHAHATCTLVAPDRHTCTCGQGYAGDGHSCSPVDPCQTEQGGCPAETTRCVYDGPGSHHCECLPGFQQLDRGGSCRLQDACRPNSCHEKAKCATVQPGVVQCTCPEGYLGNGKVCYGNIMQRMIDLNTEPGGQWTGQLTDAITVFGSVSWPLQKLGPFTVFVPVNRGFGFTSRREIMADPLRAQYLCRLHMVAGSVPRDSLRRADVFYTLTGKAGETDDGSPNAQTKIRLRGSKKKALILEGDIIASNGLIHLINKLMDSGPPTVDSDTQENLMKVISDYGKFSKFKSLLEKASQAALMDSPGPYTVFIPTNNALDAMPDGHLQYLTSVEGHGKLVELIRNHIVDMKLDVFNMVTSPRVSSIANQLLVFNVSQNGRVFVNERAVLEADVKTRNGLLYSLDGVLVPASILPILPHRCDVTKPRVVEGPCQICSKSPTCTSGTYVRTVNGCVFSLPSMVYPIQGCSPRCEIIIKTPACCPGFYGADCSPCPGGYQNPCSGQGQCMEGSEGNGTCVCRSGFRGSRCQYCALPNKYGPGCDQTCPCLRGTCDNRPDADGRCRQDSCLPGYTGARCERHTQACGPQVHFCHAHADCDFSQGVAQCVCRPGYQGDGIVCVERDPCAPPSRGGCSPNSKCIKTGPNEHVCKCLAGWTLDGEECQPINDCNSPGRGGCHGNATCIFIGPGQSDCMCKTGYQGDGIYCEPTNLCVAQQGRGCHFQARCQLVSGQWRCVCEDGFVGDGEVCYGTVEQELMALPDASGFLTWVTDAGLAQSLSKQNITLLVPTTAAIKNMAEDDRDFWTTKGNLPSVVRNHVIRGSYPLSSFMASSSPVTSLLNTSLSVAVAPSSSVVIGGATITLANVAATNGLIHMIDKVLVPERKLSEGLLEVLALRPEFSLFRAALIQHNLTAEIEQMGEYTVFAPINAAVENYRRTSSAHVMDRNTTLYHVVPSERLLKTQLQAAGYKETMLGYSYQLAIFLQDGKLLVNGAQLDISNLLTTEGVVHGLTSVLEIKRNRCDEVTKVDMKRSCMNCKDPLCPSGTVAKENMPKIPCVTQSSMTKFLGCWVTCVQTETVQRCCRGFFGKHCEPCPEYDGQVCSGQGTCSDGTEGTGVCSCPPTFSGTACESCIAGKYGIHCDQDCQCQAGLCSDGLLGDGTCVCDVGWRGIRCDERIGSSADELCGGVKCHTSANCVTKLSQTQCVCAAGFEGVGTDCKATDPCRGANGNCSPHAVCKRTLPGRRDCVCLPGYSGDGMVCVEIDPCALGTAACSANANCIHSGPNKTLCVCQQGYSGDGLTCQMVDPCLKKNGGCHHFAKCNKTGPGLRTCTCSAGSMGDGLSCKKTVGMEMMNRKWREFNFAMILARPSIRLFGRGPFTVFCVGSLSSVDGFTKVKKLLVKQDRQSLSYIMQSHVVMGHTLTASDLAVPRNLTTLSGEVLTTRWSQGTIFINKAKVIASDTVSMNGIIHEIDSFLVSPVMDSHALLPFAFEMLNLSYAAGQNGYQSFYTLMEEAGVAATLGGPLQVTVFLPSDLAWARLPQQQRDFLRDPQNREQLLEYIRYHIIPNEKVFSPELGHLDSARTLQGSPLQFSNGGLDAIGDIFVNAGRCRVVQRNLVFSGGVAHGIDCLLAPPSVGGRCDERKSVEVVMKCAPCPTKNNNCPGGSQQKKVEKCDLPMLSFAKHSGCRLTCVFDQWQPRCCAGYYGQHCQACPGGAKSVCSNHGYCDDGHLGNGTCRCHDGFQGVACELCTEGRYGAACEACNCTAHGSCMDGLRGSGVCFCETGWVGPRCEIPLATAPVCSPPCSPQGVCRDNNTCVCMPFYEGDGLTCTLVDLCAAGNGGCATGALCVQQGTKQGCVCPSGHSGDGFSCQPVDPCALQDNGGCHEHATCTMTGPGKKKCACKQNYIGDGVHCAVKELPINRCLQDNGACHPDAKCTDLHFEDATLGVFHVRSDQGQYRLTYSGAVAACTGRAGQLATYIQLSYAQQAGYNLCAAGWLLGARAAYPTTYSNPNCGFGHVGIVDYGLRKNLSETWDAFCFRFKKVQCECQPGYVGDGFACSGTLLQVLRSRPDLSNFLSRILNYARTSESGKRFVVRLSSLDTNATLFAPDNSGLLDNQTLSERDIEHHLTVGAAQALSQMRNGSRMRTLQGTVDIQGVADFLNPDAMTSCYVNDRFVIEADVVASNGLIHVLQGPLRAPPPPHKLLQAGHKAGMGVGLVLLLVLASGLLLLGYRVHRNRAQPFMFSYFKDEGEEVEEEEEGEGRLPTALPQANISNPLYVATPAEPAPPTAAAEDERVCFDVLPSPAGDPEPCWRP